LSRKFKQIRDLTKDVQKDVAHLINEINQYGFDFFPNHYQWERLDALEKHLNNYNNGAA